MIRLSEEQRAILNCYSGTKEEVTEELRRAIPFIEDVEFREESEDLMIRLEKITSNAFEEDIRNSMMDSIDNET